MVERRDIMGSSEDTGRWIGTEKDRYGVYSSDRDGRYGVGDRSS